MGKSVYNSDNLLTTNQKRTQQRQKWHIREVGEQMVRTMIVIQTGNGHYCRYLTKSRLIRRAVSKLLIKLLARESGDMSDSMSVCTVMKWSQGAIFGGMRNWQPSTGQILSEKTDLQKSSRIASDAAVPSGPKSRATSHDFIHALSWATFRTHRWEGWFWACWSVQERSAAMMLFLRERMGRSWVERTVSVKFCS